MMTLKGAINERHSVRTFTDTPLSTDDTARLNEMIETINTKTGLHIQLVINEPKAFAGTLARYGRFSGVNNYIALIGPKGKDLQEKCGYYGEMLVLEAQRMGLNTCWAALTFKKVPEAFDIAEGEKLVMVIAIGHGKNNGSAHNGKRLGELYSAEGTVPQWFMDGVEAASKAPTAMNQQKFRFIYADGAVSAKAGYGPYAATDLGIVKYHFEIGAERPGLFGL